AAFRPRRWRGAILKAETEVRFEVLDPYKRPVSVTADSHVTRDVVEVVIRESRDRTVTLLFDPEHNLEERILAEQCVVSWNGRAWRDSGAGGTGAQGQSSLVDCNRR